jgi:LacI family transcriptional regulator
MSYPAVTEPEDPRSPPGPPAVRRGNTWGLLSFWQFAPSSMDHNYSKILGGLFDSAGEIGYRLLLQNLDGRFDQGEEAARFCHDPLISGLAVLAPRCAEGGLGELRRLSVPAVLVAHTPSDPELSFVDLDNVEAGRLAVRHLVQKGHRQIAFIGGEIDLNANARDRHQGFLEGMERAGLTVDPRLVRNLNFTPGFAIQSVLAMLALPRAAQPTAIFCGNDNMAAAVVDVARERGLRVPDDLAVAGVDDNPVALTTSPALTTVRFPFFDLGSQAGNILQALAEDPRSAPQRVVLEPRLVVRASTGGPAPA